jgi:hypothetical protein
MSAMPLRDEDDVCACYRQGGHEWGPRQPADEVKSYRNRAHVLEALSRRGWTQSVNDEAAYLVELGLDRVRREQ